MSPDPELADQLRIAEEEEEAAQQQRNGGGGGSGGTAAPITPMQPTSALTVEMGTVEMAELLAENSTLRNQLQQSNDREHALRSELESTQHDLARVSDAHKATAANFSRMSAEHVPVHQNLEDFQRQFEQELQALQLVIKQQEQEHADVVAELEDRHATEVRDITSRHHVELENALAASSPQVARRGSRVSSGAGVAPGGGIGVSTNKRITFNQLRRVRNSDPLISTPSGREAYQEMQHGKLKAAAESQELDRGLVEENAWLKEKLKAARIANRSIEGVNYDNSMEHITSEKQATGRWSAQREQDRRDQKMKREILAYCKDQGVPPESTDWLKMVCLWKHASECSDALANEKATIKRLKADLRSSRAVSSSSSSSSSASRNAKASKPQASAGAEDNALAAKKQHAMKIVELTAAHETQLAEMREAMATVIADLDLVSSNFERLSSEHTAKHEGLIQFERQFTWETQSLQSSISRQQQEMTLNDSASKALVAELRSKVLALQAAGSKTEAALHQMETKLVRVQGEGVRNSTKAVQDTGKADQLQRDLVRLEHEKASISTRSSQLNDQLQDLSKRLDEEKVARTAAEQSHLEVLHSQLQKDGQVREQHSLLVRQIEEDHQAELTQLKEMVATASDSSSRQAMLEATNAARQRETFMQALGAKEEELAAVRLSFEEERETMAASLATELGPLSHALEGSRAELGQERQRAERTEKMLRDQIEELQSQLDQARGDINEAKAMFSEVSTDLELERDQQRHSADSQTRAAERTMDELRGQLQAEHGCEVRALTNARTEALQNLSAMQNEQQRLQTFIDSMHGELHRTRDARMNTLNESLSRNLSESKSSQDHTSKLQEVFEQLSALSIETEQLRSKLREIAASRDHDVREAQAAERSARQEGEEAVRDARQDVDRQSSVYRSRISQLENQLQEAVSDKESANTTAAQHRSSAENQAIELEERERNFKSTISDLEQKNEASSKLVERYSDAIQSTVSECLQVGGSGGGGNGSSPDDSFAASTLPSDPVRQLASLARSLERRVQATARANAATDLEKQRAAGFAARVSELESDLMFARTNIADVKEQAARSSSDAGQEQVKFTEILASVRAGFEKEKINFEEQIESARSQTADTKEHLEEARAQLIEREEALTESSADLRTLAEEHARMEATLAFEKRHKATTESQIVELRHEIARKAGDLARCQADLGTARETIQNMTSKIREREASLSVSEGTVEQLQKALGVARDAQEAASTAENDMRLTLVQVEHDVIEAEADAKAVAISLKMESEAREVAQRDSDAAQKAVAELEGEVALLEQQLQAAQVDSNLVSRLRQERNAAQLLLEEENVTRAKQSADLREEIVKLQSKVRRQKRMGDGKTADVERQLTLSKQREDAANDNIRQLERITRQLRDEAAKLQVEKETLTLEKASHQRAAVQADHAKRQNEMCLTNLRDENTSLKQDLDRQRQAKKRTFFGSAGSASFAASKGVGRSSMNSRSAGGIGSTDVYRNVSVQLQQQGAVLKDLGNVTKDVSTAASRESSRRLDSLQGQMRELDSTVRVTSSPPRRSRSAASVPSSPLNASLSRSLMLADM